MHAMIGRVTDGPSDETLKFDAQPVDFKKFFKSYDTDGAYKSVSFCGVLLAGILYAIAF